MQAVAVLRLPGPRRLEALTETGETGVVHARPVGHGARCPDCGESATHVRSRYVRGLDAVPWADRRIRRHVPIRRCWCATADCPRRICAERRQPVANPYARRPVRADTTREAVAFARGGEAGSRLARRRSVPTRPDTLRRLIRRAPAPTAPPVRICGVDDCAWRKRRRDGTALVDLERHRRIALLPERSATSVAAWLRQHPAIAAVSRDRGGGYADGARRGAPRAPQVAARFHLRRNLGAAVRRVLARHADVVRRVRSPGGGPALTRLRPDRAAARARTRAQMAACFAAGHAAAARGLSTSAIARALGVHRPTVSILAPYAA